MSLPCLLRRARLFGDYHSLQQREVRGIICCIEQSLVNNAYIPLFRINTLPCRVHYVVPLMKLRLIFSLVVLTKLRCKQ
ncbi:uncharacterized protein RHIMIDRAFT_278662 [Rhizopus microsporus ATCC 52813]|uniref:Uncharacterized protein n=1 Tax=Rhizopus microsporus ATCC 52813 TaxID=1340429 RepID=A0A2G4SZS3_RHIZD|nr:uncharacterized protein RHIMIDRAFT_278662 [Rhizopus microsporus ATCC 52813]PHZ14273.1 hypothetical protein RHIMIDRAFT_278662 [Rhizopus microsporus ATCC 52813]